jgi:catechol 2,3-dioxygenase-like lactoylglutathione lyase family enzyme
MPRQTLENVREQSPFKPTISGIQQVGIGVSDARAAFRWYRLHFGMDIPVFEDLAQAGLMAPYTGGETRQRHAILTINLRGGGGLEIWQRMHQAPRRADSEPKLGDLGIFCVRIKTSDVHASYAFLKSKHVELRGPIRQSPDGCAHFFARDPYGNFFQLVPGHDWFGRSKFFTGGTCGSMIGVSDMERSIQFYRNVLGYEMVAYDLQGAFPDLDRLPGAERNARRVLLTHSQPRTGPFSRLLGSSQIELIQVLAPGVKRIFANRCWGDLGFIHLCFDITGMADMKRMCEAAGHSFTVDSGPGFEMGAAAGHFSYVEDPDGTMIEFVETHKLPIIRKLGWYLDLMKRPRNKPLPDWILKAMALNRAKD